MLLTAALFLGLVAGNPLLPRQDAPSCTTSSTSSQWLSICDTTVFWPTATNYYYGPTIGPEAPVVSCNAEWVEYNGRADGLESLGATSTSTIYRTYTTSTGACNTEIWGERYDDPHTGPVTTLCDSVTRALGPRETLTSYWPGTGPCSSFEVTETETTPVYRSPTPTPSCSLNSIDCIPIWETYTSLSSAYRSVDPQLPGDTNSPIRPTACPTTKRNYTVEDPCTNCHYLPGTATMFYWPSSTPGGLCDSDSAAVADPTPTAGPNTAIINGNTFISPTVYVSFTTVSARSNQRAHPGGPCGADHVDAIISIDPASVPIESWRSHRNAKYPTIGTAYPFNFGDYQPHEVGNYTMPLIPWEEYQGGSQCPLYTGCEMIRDDYMPWMGIPDGVMNQIDERWTMCHRSWYIPPVSLVPLVGGLEATMTAAVQGTKVTETAVPVSALAVPTPDATGEVVEEDGDSW